MRRAAKFLPTAILIFGAGLLLAGCGGSPGEVRYINRTNSTDVLTLNRDKTVKTKLISTFHGVSNGTYKLETATGTTSGRFSSDSEGIKFRPENGEPETTKFKSDGSFDYAHVTWEQRPVVMEKGLKALASSKEGAPQ